MATKKKLLEAAAGNAVGGGLNVEDVFSTYLYDGNGSTQTITNGIDLAGEGGMVWLKARSFGRDNNLYNTINGDEYHLSTNRTDFEEYSYNMVTAFNSDGFSIGANGDINDGIETFASWTFRKAPKFFDVVTYTGDGSSPRTISHNLGTTVGHITVKPTSSTGSWWNFHRTLGAGKALRLNSTDAVLNSNNFWGGVEPTSTEFTVQFNNNASGVEYVAYLFAHNDGDGDFGPDGDADIIKCGGFTTDSGGNITIDLGWEPQWLLVKQSDGTGDWRIIDNMRGWTNDNGFQYLKVNTSEAEASWASGILPPSATGFSGSYPPLNGSADYIYIAIRRGPMAVPESGDEVFDISTGAGTDVPTYPASFPVDFGIYRPVNETSNWYCSARLTQDRELSLNNTDAELSDDNNKFDYMDGWRSVAYDFSTYYSWMWKRAPNFFDAVAYTGDGTNDRALKHNLGVEPEFIISKRRDGVEDWGFWVNSELWYGSPETDYPVAKLNTADGTFYSGIGKTNNWDASQIIIESGAANPFATNVSGHNYVMYMFATLSGISKCGLYTGNGTSQTIDCGFTSGARFVLIKRTDSTGDWYVWDTERGIVAANDPHLSLNTTAAEVTTDDSIDPVSSGFAVNQVAATNINVSSATYIYYAVA